MESVQDLKGEIKFLQEKITQLESEKHLYSEAEAYHQVIEETALSIINRHDLDKLFEIILNRACKFLQSENGFVYLLEPNDSMMKMRVGTGIFKKYTNSFHHINEGLVKQIYESKSPVIINSDINLLDGDIIFQDVEIKSLIALPIKSDERVIGIFGIASLNENQQFKNSDIKFLNGFVQLCLIALDNSKLFTYLQDEFNEVIRVENELRDSEKRYRTLFELATDAIFLHDNEKLIECNHKTLNLFNLTLDKIIGKSIFSFSPKFQPDKVVSIKKAEQLLSVAFAEKILNFDWQFQREDLGTMDCEVNLGVVQILGQPLILGIIRDITTKKRVQEEIKRQNVLLSDIFSWVQEGIVMLDETEHIVYCNPAFDFIFEDKIENLVTKNFYDFVDKEYLSLMKNNAIERRNGNISTYEIKIITPKGNNKIVRISFSPYFGKTGVYGGSFASVLDITERFINEENLKLSESNYRMLVNSIQDGIFIVKSNVILFANQMLARMFGVELNSLIGADFKKFVASEDHPLLEQIFSQHLKIDIFSKEVELRMLHSNQVDRLYVVVQIGMINFQGTEAILGTVKDLTIRMEAELEIKKSEEKYKLLFSSVSDAIILFNMENYEIFEINSACQKLYGYSYNEFIKGMKFYNIFNYSESLNELLLDIKKGVIEGKIPLQYHKKKNGNIFAVEITIDRIKLKGGIVGVAIIRDISERVRNEAILKESEEKFFKAFHFSSDIMFITRFSDGLILDVNESALKVSGFTHSQLVGKPFKEFSFIPDEFSKRIRSTLEKGEKFQNVEVHTKSHNDDELTLLVSASLIDLNDENYIISIARDISQTRKLQDDLQKAQKLESVGILAGGIAHDFNNILTGILGNISLAKLYAIPGDKIYHRLLEAEKSSLRAKDLTQQLITFAKGGDPIKKISSLSDLLKNTIQNTIPDVITKVEIDQYNEGWEVQFDVEQIRQVFTNILLNAKDSMEMKLEDPLIELKLENVYLGEQNLLSLRKGKYVKISIKDYGVGIPRDNLKKIFDPFFSTKQTRRGIGLSIAYSIIKKHNGFIDVESTENEGTLFSVYLPVSELNVEKIEEPEKIFPAGNRILLMDDEETVLEFGKELLHHFGYNVSLAKNSHEAIESFKNAINEEEPFDLVILDLTIPGGIGGYEVLRKLQEIDPKVKAIVSSGYSDDPIMSDYKKYGFCAELAKPYQVHDMKKTLNQVFQIED